MSTMNYATKFQFEQSTNQCGHDFSMLLKIKSLFLIYFFVNANEQQLFLLTHIPLTVDKFNNIL